MLLLSFKIRELNYGPSRRHFLEFVWPDLPALWRRSVDTLWSAVSASVLTESLRESQTYLKWTRRREVIRKYCLEHLITFKSSQGSKQNQSLSQCFGICGIFLFVVYMCQMTDARYIQLKPKKPTEFEEYTGIVQKKAYVTPPPSHGSFLGSKLLVYSA